MNSKTTGTWFAIAAALFALILILQRHWNAPVGIPGNILADLQPSAATSIQVHPAGALEIRADRTNGNWFLTEPIIYPAQTAAIEMLLDALQKLTPATRIGAGELQEHHDTDTEFGFEPPQISLVIEAGDQHWHLLVGNKTAPGDQVFLRVVGLDGAFVADADWLKFIPRSVNDWRNTSLVDANENNFDAIVLTSGAKTIELHCDATNHLWYMTRPLQARANSERINSALQYLQTARVSQFITDNPNTDLTVFGLQPADLDLWLGHGTNFVTGIHLGKNPTTDSTQIYVQRQGWNAIVTTADEPFSPWRGSVNDFRDPHLFELNAPVNEIEVRGTNGADNFTLQRQGTNDWKIEGEKFPADAESVQAFIQALAQLRVAEFVKDVVTAPDLQAYGLAAPSRQIILLSIAGDTNSVIAQLAFAVQTNGIFVRRADEDFIYSITGEDFNNLWALYGEDWEFRDRHIWHFTENDVAQITLHQNGRTRVMVRNGPNKWSLAADSQGIINPPAIEETMHRLGELTATYWVGRNITAPEKYGIEPGNLQISVELKSGEKMSVDFGTEIPRANTALAAVTLAGEHWAFVFPPVLYQFVLSYLIIPANVP
jgi:hypothetical protein